MEQGSRRADRPSEAALPDEVRVVATGLGDVAADLETADDRLRVVTASSALDRVDDTDADCLLVGAAPDEDPVALLRSARERRPHLATVLAAPPTADVLPGAVAAGLDRFCPVDGTPDPEAVVADVLGAVADRVRERHKLDRLTEGFIILDEEFRFIYLNQAATDVIRAAAGTERSRSEYLGRSLFDEVPEAVGTVFHEKYVEAIETQEPVSFEASCEPLEEWFEVSVYPSETGVSVYFPTTTERRAYEDELERRQRVLRDLYRITADKDRTFEEKVDALLDIGRAELGTDYGVLSRIENGDYVIERARSAEPMELSNGDRVPLSWTNCEVAVSSEKTLVVNDIQSDPDLADREGNVAMGLTCYLGAPVTVGGEVRGTFCFFDDDPRTEPFSEWQTTLVDLMGEWVSYERERREREQRLTRERDRLDQFASAVSHDLRNPLNVAQARLELLADEVDGGDDNVAAIDRSLARMEALIEDVLSLARLGREVVDTESVAFERLVHDARETVGVEGEFVFEGPRTVAGDETRLQRLFENLFRNAREHAATGGAVTVEVGSLSDGFYVADDGPGIPEDEREDVFESGYSTAEDGTGFGLAIVRGIVVAHGWSVRVTDSELGGARFEVTGVSGVTTED